MINAQHEAYQKSLAGTETITTAPSRRRSSLAELAATFAATMGLGPAAAAAAAPAPAPASAEKST